MLWLIVKIILYLVLIIFNLLIYPRSKT